MDKKRQMLSIKELADILNVSQKTIRRHINSGKIKSVKLGGIHRISREEISSLLKEEIIDDPVIQDDLEQQFPFPNKIPSGELKNKWSKHTAYSEFNYHIRSKRLYITDSQNSATRHSRKFSRVAATNSHSR